MWREQCTPAGAEQLGTGTRAGNTPSMTAQDGASPRTREACSWLGAGLWLMGQAALPAEPHHLLIPLGLQRLAEHRWVGCRGQGESKLL